ncbi:MAG TPA: S8 family peptidase [Bdellovibrionales bacterium]|nr:S8 family peptidase [Bdellovibrionales bacterium]
MQNASRAPNMKVQVSRTPGSATNKFKYALLTAAVILVQVGCAQKAPLAWKDVPAGQSPQAMGIVVDGASVAEMTNLETEGGKIREIYGRAGMYEVFGLTAEKVKKSVGASARVYENKFLPHKQKVLPFQNRIPHCDQLEEVPEFGFVSEPAALAATGDEGPVTYKRNGRKVVISLGGTGLSQIKYKLGLVSAPDFSALSPEQRGNGPLISENGPLEFTPDEMGQYIVAVIAQLPQGSMAPGCARLMAFGVTDDAPYLGPAPLANLPVDQKVKAFPHLAAVGADKAWPTTQGQGVLIAVVDSGINYNHPALRNNIYVNPREVAGNNRDDDGNGLVDDTVGWDFANNDAYPFDDYMHGSHVMGLAASAVGVAPEAKVMAIKGLGMFGGDVGSIVGAIKYAIDSGAKIVNLSLGSYVPNPALQEIMRYSEMRGALVVIASGNDGLSIEQKPVFPASYKNDNLLVVGATDMMGTITPYSNWGDISVDVMAPGGTEQEGIRSTYYANGRNQLWYAAHGTSFAAPVVTGVAALAWAAHPKATALQIKKLLIDRGALRQEYRGKCSSSKFIDARNLTASGLGLLQ